MAIIGTVESTCIEEPQVFSGIEKCSKKEEYTVGMFVTDDKARFPADKALFLAELEANINSGKLTPLKSFIENTMSGGDVATNEIGFAGPVPSGYNALNETYRFEPGSGDCLYKSLMPLNQQKKRVIRIDKDGYVYGTLIQEGDTASFAGFSSYIVISRTKATSNTDVYNLSLIVYYGVNYKTIEEPNLHAFELGEIPDGIVGVSLEKGTTSGTARVVSSCGGTDYTLEYGAEFADESLFADKTGAAPTSVAFNSTTGLLTFTPVGEYRILDATSLAAKDIIGLGGVNKYTSLT
ncbi:hypothetical protein [Dysgonomonas macrotermitis]|uniref:Uncharacterized protein n=1 Tax=Dysgonomonas macrotermitis TaxID=1346286 RepID=A0A1M5C596_9BACT|nr:hypothetical protein [Dysgonomonas macrotermitis]SHF49928.1 hypothetical protein SAMN05444362_10736 [Dysgonomonas macrotermitis]